METRKGFKLVKDFPDGEYCVAMCEYKGEIIVATNLRIYKVKDGKLRELEIETPDP